MFQRIVYEDWQLIFPVVALVVATLVYGCAALRGATMKSEQAGRPARVPREAQCPFRWPPFSASATGGGEDTVARHLP